jgi:hypothetical protein
MMFSMELPYIRYATIISYVEWLDDTVSVLDIPEYLMKDEVDLDWYFWKWPDARVATGLIMMTLLVIEDDTSEL